jgi:hypothetical protein
MSKSNDFENDLVLLVFQNANAANIGDATGLRGSSTAGNLFISLHTSDPGEAGNQSTNEIAYTSYARVSLARTSGNFTVTANAVAFAANVDFPAGTGGSGTATHFGIGVATSGSTKLLYKGALSPSIVCGNGVTPRINAGTVVTED